MHCFVSRGWYVWQDRQCLSQEAVSLRLRTWARWLPWTAVTRQWCGSRISTWWILAFTRGRRRRHRLWAASMVDWTAVRTWTLLSRWSMISTVATHMADTHRSLWAVSMSITHCFDVHQINLYEEQWYAKGRSNLCLNPLMPTVAIGYRYKASCARPGLAVICNFWHLGTLTLRAERHAQSWASECPDVKNHKWLLNPVWHRMLYSLYPCGNSWCQRVKWWYV